MSILEDAAPVRIVYGDHPTSNSKLGIADGDEGEKWLSTI